MQQVNWLYLRPLMPEFLLHIDRKLFYLVNHSLTNPFFDWIMPWLRNPLFWIPVYAFIIIFSIWKYKKAGVILVLTLLAAVGFADFTSAGIIKKQVMRNRPCRDEVLASSITTRVPCGTGYSFPSTHAADHFAMSVFLSLAYFKKWRWVWLWTLLWAMLVCFAQVYVGVHYPIDVTGGAVYGSVVALSCAYFFKKIQPVF